ncbi:hypothetical protein [Streptomyces sp. NL15-2K]|uniref:hypothetical protein n=1 Tax=Streptomyces sp. NL15-2K TaxID=376149 RepID=UPI000F5713FB|nr:MULTISPECIES: hypothetical protein [Actinomycetes]WKX09853.1 hypothetical protein Q4V64_21115 [Kutzneria buriramensis]
MVHTRQGRAAATIALASVVNLILGYLGNSIVDMPWRLLEVWVLPEHGLAPQPSPTDTDDGMGTDVAAIIFFTVPYLLMCAFANYLVAQTVNVHRMWYALIAFVALITPAVAFSVVPSLYAEIPRP